jgi:amino acid adenylation domain-containing protein
MLVGNCLHKMFEMRAKESPDKVAVRTINDAITYRELDMLSNSVACGLQQMGVVPNTIVGLCVDRSIELIVGMLAILKAGGAYVPIDPSYPQKRIHFLLEDSAVDIVVAVSRTADALSGGRAKAVLIDDSESFAGTPDFRAVANQGSDLAYVIYTSGSTGAPKGVLIEHLNVIRLFTQTEDWFHFRGDDVWTMFHSASFDFSVWEIWGALLYGGELIIVPYEITRSPGQFRTLVEKMKVTVLNQTPSAFQQLVNADIQEKRAAEWKLRCVIFGGEALDVKILAPWIGRYGDKHPQLINMYGITETTVHVSYRRIVEEDLEKQHVSPLGVPIPDLQVHLLDERGEPVPDGVAGEMYVCGGGLARGYLRRPELTAERFRTNTGIKPEGTRVYASGDRAVRLPSGDLAYLGRSDSQLKVRGFRIEPREIELCLNAHRAVLNVAVSTDDYGDGDVRLSAYVVPRPDLNRTKETEKELMAELGQQATQELPIHMRPSSYYFVSEFPLTANGKIDRAALKQLVEVRQEAKSNYEALNRTEQEVARIWEEVLQHDNIGVRDDFFDLGGTSLALIRILGLVNRRFGTTLDGSVLAEGATISCLASSVDAQLQQKLQQLSSVEENDANHAKAC